MIDRCRLTDSGGVIVDQVALELPDLVIIKHDLGKLANPGIDAIHNLASAETLFDEAPTTLDTGDRIWVERYLLAATCACLDVLDGQR